MNGFKAVYVNEDLISLRNAMLGELKKDPTIKSCWSVEGKIFCRQSVDGQEVTKAGASEASEKTKHWRSK